MTGRSVGLLSPQRIVEAALGGSVADGCVVVVSSSSSANIRWANNTVTTNGVAQDLSFFVVSVVGGAAATVAGSASDAASAESVAAVVSAAHAAAVAASRLGRARDAQPLVESGAGGADDFDDDPADTSFAVFDSLLAGLADAFPAARSDDRVLYGFVDHDVTTTYLGSSTGLRLRWVQPTGTLEINAKSADLRRSAWAGLSTPDFAGPDLGTVLASLGQRLEWAKRTIDLPPGRYRTVLPPTAVADLMINLAWSAGAREAHEGRSAFAAPGGGTRSGERLTDRPLTLFSDPTVAGLAAAPFVVAGHSSDDVSVFDNGAPIGRHDFVRDGVIGSLLHTRGSAVEFGEPFTPTTDNLVLSGGAADRDIDALVADVDRGLLLTSQWYIREVDPMTLLLTGLTRDGVFLIERGEVVGAVNNFRFNMSPLDILGQAADVGATVPTLSREWSDWFTRTAMPPITVDGFNMSSVSPAT
ncbi:MAG TPA: metallopeptidase TldD-related protein [Nakamurella sp.]